MSRRKQEWDLTAKISVAGLAVTLFASLLGNFVQYNQNAITNKRADAEAQRADVEAGKADLLKKKKEDWYNRFNSRLAEIDKRIQEVSDNLRLEGIDATLIENGHLDFTNKKIEQLLAELEGLQREKEMIQKLLNDFLSAYR